MILDVACIQLNAQSNPVENIQAAERAIRQAAKQGAKFILTPENTCGIYPDVASKIQASLPDDQHAALPVFSKLAHDLGVWLLAGSLSVKINGNKVHNRSYLFGADGHIAATYNKIHLFDANLPTGEVRLESETVEAGNKATLAQTPFGKVGMTICYDVRFAHLYRLLAQSGAQIITVPSAFTVPTGKAHWETLLRARAIETGCFILAPAQTGDHNGVRQTYGHSMIIDPWGKILAQAGTDPTIIQAQIDLSAVAKARAAVPALQHDRPFNLEEK